MFKPASGRISSEVCSNTGDWTLATGQILDGTLRLRPTTTEIKRTKVILPDLPTDPDYAATTPQASLWAGWTDSDDGAVWLSSMEYLYCESTAAGGRIEGYASNETDNVGTVGNYLDNATGWTMDIRCISWYGRCRIVINDGTKTLDLVACPEGLFNNSARLPWLQDNPENAIFPIPEWVYDYETYGESYGGYKEAEFPQIAQHITLRITVHGNNVRFKTKDRDVYLPNWSGLRDSNSDNKGITFFMPITYHRDRKDCSGSFAFNELKVWNEPDMNIHRYSTLAFPVYPTSAQISFTPSYQSENVKRFQYAVYDVQNETGDGILQITPQYRSGAGAWNDGSAETLAVSQKTQELGYVGYDQIRFKVSQVSNDGSGDAPRLDKVTVVSMAEDEGSYRIRPGYGMQEGGNTVAFDMVTTPTNLWYSTGDTLLIKPNTGGPIDQAAAATITQVGTVYNNSLYTQLGRMTGEISLLSYNFLSAQADAPGFGTGISALGGATGSVKNRRHPGTYTVEPMQKVDAVAGQGIQFTNITGLTNGQRYVLEFPLWVVSGEVKLTGNSLDTNLRMDKSRLMRVAFRSTGTSLQITFTAQKTSQFYVGRPRLYTAQSGHLTTPGTSRVNSPLKFVLGSKFYLAAYPNKVSPVFTNSPGTDLGTGFSLGLDGHGSPYLRVGSEEFTGDYLFPLGRWQSIQARVDIPGGEARLFANGSFVGKLDISGGTTNPGTGDMYVGYHENVDSQFFCGSIAYARHTTEFLSDFDTSYKLARRTTPKFQCSYEPEVDSQTLVSLNFNQSAGIIENKGSLENPIIPQTNRPYVQRGVRGVHSQGVRFERKSVSDFGDMVITDDQTWLNEDFILEGYVRAGKRYHDQTIMSVGGTGDMGFQVQIDTGGYLVYHFRGATDECTLRSDQVADIKITSGGYQYWHWAVAHNRNIDSVGMWIEGDYVAGQIFGGLGNFSGQTELHIGSENGTGDALYADLDEIKVWTGDLTTYQLSWPANRSKWTPSETVYVDGNALHPGRVTHYSPERKLVVMPAHAPGYVETKVVGSTFYGIDPYKYIYGYHVVTNTGEIEARFGSTRSPFRVLNRVPDHGVPIALLSTQVLSVDTHMSKTELSDRDPANRTGYGSQISVLRNGVTDDHEYQDAVDTDEVLVSNYSAQWRSLTSPRPLYFKYLVGRGRYYVSVPNAENADDLDAIRQAIRLTGTNGEQRELVWDVLATSLDFHGNALSGSLYSVVLLLETIPAVTTWVEYLAADTVESYAEVGVRKEIVNPVPLFGKHSGRMGISLDNNAVGSYNVTVTP